MNEEIKLNIFQVSSSLFEVYGIKNVTMDEIAKTLSISKKTLYSHFFNKEHLVTELMKFRLAELTKEVTELYNNSNHTIEEMIKLTMFFRTQIETKNARIFIDLKKYYHKGWELLLIFQQNVIKKSLMHNIEAGISEGYYRHDIDAEIITQLHISTFEASISNISFSTDNQIFKKTFFQLIDHFIYGLLSDKGREFYNRFQIDKIL